MQAEFSIPKVPPFPSYKVSRPHLHMHTVSLQGETVASVVLSVQTILCLEMPDFISFPLYLHQSLANKNILLTNTHLNLKHKPLNL